MERLHVITESVVERLDQPTDETLKQRKAEAERNLFALIDEVLNRHGIEVRQTVNFQSKSGEARVPIVIRPRHTPTVPFTMKNSQVVGYSLNEIRRPVSAKETEREGILLSVHKIDDQGKIRTGTAFKVGPEQGYVSVLGVKKAELGDVEAAIRFVTHVDNALGLHLAFNPPPAPLQEHERILYVVE